MPRPVKIRRVCGMPKVREFMPCSEISTDKVLLSVEEYEVIRLIDSLGYSQKESSEQIGVARTTVQAMYDSARGKIADAIVNGKRLIIEGGSYTVCPHSKKCCGKNCCRHESMGKMCRKSE